MKRDQVHRGAIIAVLRERGRREDSRSGPQAWCLGNDSHYFFPASSIQASPPSLDRSWGVDLIRTRDLGSFCNLLLMRALLCITITGCDLSAALT